MTPNFFPAFGFNDLVRILDETGFPTGQTARVSARFVGRPGEEGPAEYVVTMVGRGGCPHFPAARLEAVATSQKHGRQNAN